METRAPDETLTSYLEGEGGDVDVAVAHPYKDGSVAHRITGRADVACGAFPCWYYTIGLSIAHTLAKVAQECKVWARTLHCEHSHGLGCLLPVTGRTHRPNPRA